MYVRDYNKQKGKEKAENIIFFLCSLAFFILLFYRTIYPNYDERSVGDLIFSIVVLSHNLQCLAKILDNVIQNKRVTYDGLNNIMMLLISRLLGLNGEMVSDEDIERFVNEAMAQAGAG